MILADKIIALRKKSGWSQEELAERLGVTRQAVSKWEGAQSTPDLDKLLMMSRVFGVSTDLLLKDELETPEIAGPGDAGSEPALALPKASPAAPPARKVSLAEASAFLATIQANVKWMALGVPLCVLSPIPLLLLCAAHQWGRVSLREEAAAGLGVVALLSMVAVAVGLFLFYGSVTKQYDYLEREPIDADPGVAELAREWQRGLQPRRTVFLIVGVCLCILSATPLLWAGMMTQDKFVHAAALCLLLLLVAVAVALFISAGIPWDATEQLLQEGDHTVRKKQVGPLKGTIAAIYWSVVVALFLLVGLLGGHWHWAGIIFPVAGVLFGAIVVLIDALAGRKEQSGRD